METLRLRRAAASDVAYMHRLSRDPENAPYITPWTRRQHEAALKDRDCIQFIVEAGGRRSGFAILRGLKDREKTLELKRIVIESKGAGHGREAVRRIQKLAFEKFGARCLWLDVKEFNSRARKLYEAEGFVKEGALRERVRFKGRYHALIVMSKLRSEYSPASRRLFC